VGHKNQPIEQSARLGELISVPVIKRLSAIDKTVIMREE